MQGWALDFRYALRMLAVHRRVTAVAVLSLALGLGANIAIFSLVYAVLLRPLPYKDPDRLTIFWESHVARGSGRAMISAPNFIDYRSQNTVFEGMAAFETVDVALTGVREAEQVRGLAVTEGFFSVLGVRPFRGRDFLPAETQAGGPCAVVLSQGFWQRRFGGEPQVVGRALALNGVSCAVTGIMPAGFEFPDREAEFWMGRGFSAAELRQRGYHRMGAVARFKPGVQRSQAVADLNRIAAHLAEQYPVTNRGWGVFLVPVREERVRWVRTALLIIVGAAGLVLLIACTNVASLLVARNAAREKEIAVRAALGAGRGRLLGQSLTESLLLALLAGGVGLALTPFFTRVLLSLSPKGFVLPQRVGLDPVVLSFGLAAALLVALLSGLLPAMQALRTNLSESLKEGGRAGGAGLSRQRARSCLVIAEVAVALVLLAGAGVMLRSFLRLRVVDSGFRTDHLLTARLFLPAARYGEARQKTSFHRDLLERVRALPGVESAAAGNCLPLISDFGRAFTIGGRPIPPPGQWLSASYRSVTPEYFRTLGIPILRGRAFTDQDHADAPGVAIVNQTLARQQWPNGDPIGQQINLERPERQHAWRTIVGVAGDVRHRGPDANYSVEVYAPYYQMPEAAATLAVRSASDPAGLAVGVRAALRAADPNLPPGQIRTMEQLVAESDSLSSRRSLMVLLGAFAVLAVLLAGVGVYGVISYSVAQRRQEIGLRMALGAQRGDVLRLVIRQALGLALAGVAIGAGLALALTRFLGSLVYQVSASDPLTFTAVGLLLVLVSLAASYLPAWAATRVDPMAALRVG